jgi:hypothetical protein
MASVFFGYCCGYQTCILVMQLNILSTEGSQPMLEDGFGQNNQGTHLFFEPWSQSWPLLYKDLG